MYKLDTISEDSWFCNLEHLYAYKAARDVEYNPEYNLWLRVQHYTESTRNAGHAYDLNQSRIYRLAAVQLDESDETIAQALVPQKTDCFNQDYSDSEISIILRAPQAQLTEDKEEQLQRILSESFDTSHPDFDQRQAMINLHHNFAGTAALCDECLMVKAKTDEPMDCAMSAMRNDTHLHLQKTSLNP
jgi:hypothetical protein